MKRVGIIGFLHESNTFSPISTTYNDFITASLTQGEALIDRWRGSHHELGGFLQGAEAFEFLPVPVLATYAMPGGRIKSESFTRLADEISRALRSVLPLDGLLVALHGAAVAENVPDADGEISHQLRQAVGPTTPIIMTLDLHANVSTAMIRNTDALICYRSNPHIDQEIRGLEAARLMAGVLKGKIRPVQALESPPLIVNIAKQNTQQPPASTLYEELDQVLNWPGILSASVAMGFYYADVEEMGASFIAVADGDPKLAGEAARWMAIQAWQRRQEFQAALPTPAEAVRHAARAAQGPVVLMDTGDNIGGGSPGDSTILFEEILRQGVPNALVILYDPEAVSSCVMAGVRQEVELSVGGKTDALHGSPILVRGSVRSIHDGIFVEKQIRHGGWGTNDQGITAVLQTDQMHTLVLTSRRMAPMSLEQILSLGIKPEDKKILVAKGVIAPRAAYEPIAREIITVDTPGCTSVNPANFEYRRRRRPLFPLEPGAVYPTVTTTQGPMSD